MKRWVELVFILAVVAVVVAFVYKKEEKPLPSPSSTPEPVATAASTPRPVEAAIPPPSPVSSSGLDPLPGKQNVPAITEKYTVEVETSEGNFTLEIYPQAAPLAAERFVELVQAGFYDGIPVSRVVNDFVVQFGINPQMVEWKEKKFDDDPSYFQHLPGTLAFAKAGPNTATTQVFINLVENNRLAEPGLGFTVFGRVTDGMDTIRKFKNVGNSAGGLDQQRLWTEPDYLDGLAEKPTMITRMRVVEPWK